jgi:ABC-type enterochelin transport system substrate-binding protein
MKLKLSLLILVMSALFDTQEASAQEIRTLKVQGNVYLLSGAGGNVVVQVGEEGVVVIDTGAAGRSDALVAASGSSIPTCTLISLAVTTLFAKRELPSPAPTWPAT